MPQSPANGRPRPTVVTAAYALDDAPPLDLPLLALPFVICQALD